MERQLTRHCRWSKDFYESIFRCNNFLVAVGEAASASLDRTPDGSTEVGPTQFLCLVVQWWSRKRFEQNGAKLFLIELHLNLRIHYDLRRFLFESTDTQWRHESKKSENLGRCGRQNILQPYLKIWEWELIFGRAVKTISSPGVLSPCPLPPTKMATSFMDAPECVNLLRVEMPLAK